MNKFDDIVNNDGKIENSSNGMTVALNKYKGIFSPNRFHYAQTLELFSVPEAKVEGDLLETNGSIAALKA